MSADSWLVLLPAFVRTLFAVGVVRAITAYLSLTLDRSRFESFSIFLSFSSKSVGRIPLESWSIACGIDFASAASSLASRCNWTGWARCCWTGPGMLMSALSDAYSA
jgi:hypothetical protein